MTNKIKPKQSITANAIPETLERGELAINVTDRKLYSSDGNTVFELTSSGNGGGGNATPGGLNTQIQFNDSNTFAGNASFTYNKTTNTISIGNSTVNATINSTFFSQTSNNALTANIANSALFANVSNTVTNISNTQIIAALGYVPADSANGLGYVPVNKAGDTMTGQLNVGSNVQLTLSSLLIGNSTVNVSANSSMFRIGTANVWTTSSLTNVSQLANDAGYITNVVTSLGYTPANTTTPIFSGPITIGNSTVNVVANSTVITVGSANVWTTASLTNVSQLANDAAYITSVNTSLGYSPANKAGDTFTGSVNVGSNVSLGLSSLFIGNSTVNAVINSSSMKLGTFFEANSTYVYNPSATAWFGTTYTDLLVSRGGSAGLLLFRRDSNVGSWVLYSSAGSLSVFDQINATDRFSFTNTGTFTVGSNITLSTSTLSIGNSTQNTVTNSSGFYVNGVAVGGASGDYVLKTGDTMSGQLNVGSNVQLTTATLIIGNSTINSTVNSTFGVFSNGVTTGNYVYAAGFVQGGSSVYAGSNVFMNTSVLFVGNSTINAASNSSIFKLSSNSTGHTQPLPSTNVGFHALSTGGQVDVVLEGFAVNPRLIMRRSGGTAATPTPPASTDQLGAHLWQSYNASGNAYNTIGQILSVTTEAHTNTAAGALIRLRTTPTGSNAIANVVTFFGNGQVWLENTAGNITMGNSTINSIVNSSYFSIVGGGASIFANSSYLQHTSGGSYTLISPAASVTGFGVVNKRSIFIANSEPWSMYIQANTTLAGYYLGSHNTSAETFVLSNTNGTMFLYANATAGLNVTANVTTMATFLAGSNVKLSTSSLFIGNSTVNATINSSSLYVQGGIVYSSGFIQSGTQVYAGSNVYMNTSAHFAGNSTVNTTINSTGMSILGTGGSLGVGTTQSGTVGEIRATANITAYYSDMRLKTDIEIIPNAIEKVKAISGVYYRTNELAKSFGYTDDKTLQIGVLAQEIEKIFPQLVQIAPFDSDYSDGTLKSKSGKNYLTVNQQGLIPLLIQAIKELSNKVDHLENELNKYKNNTS